MKTTLNYIYVSIEGDYYQVMFEEKEDNGDDEITDNPYFLIQCQFEMYDGGEIYIESHDENYIGHFSIRRASLQKDKFEIELERPNYSKVEINFKATDKEFVELSSALNTMLSKEKLKIITI
jgi:hypothetical protein